MTAQDDYAVVYQVAKRFLARNATIGELRQAVRQCEAREYRVRLRRVRERMQEVQGRKTITILTNMGTWFNCKRLKGKRK